MPEPITKRARQGPFVCPIESCPVGGMPDTTALYEHARRHGDVGSTDIPCPRCSAVLPLLGEYAEHMKDHVAQDRLQAAAEAVRAEAAASVRGTWPSAAVRRSAGLPPLPKDKVHGLTREEWDGFLGTKLADWQWRVLQQLEEL